MRAIRLLLVAGLALSSWPSAAADVARVALKATTRANTPPAYLPTRVQTLELGGVRLPPPALPASVFAVPAPRTPSAEASGAAARQTLGALAVSANDEKTQESALQAAYDGNTVPTAGTMVAADPVEVAAAAPTTLGRLGGWLRSLRPSAHASKKGPPGRSLQEATRELIRLRYNVRRHDAPSILQDNLGGDVGDGILHKDVTRVLNRLTAAAGMPKQSAQIFIGNSFLPNAFTMVSPSEASYLKDNASVAKALRISNVFVSLGLLRALENEDQLAFILAHELNHNWRGHLKDFQGSHMVLGHFHEFEADAEALKLLAAAGYDPKKAIDTLYALDREYARLKKKYSLLRGADNDIVQALKSLRDIHPHSDLRRAYLDDHLNEAYENARPQSVPANPAWMARRLTSERPSHTDRFEKKLGRSVSMESRDGAIHDLEALIKVEGAHRGLDVEKSAVIEKSYRDLMAAQGTAKELRPIEVSVGRSHTESFPSKRLIGELVTRQLELLFGAPWSRASKNARRAARAKGAPAAPQPRLTLEDFASRSAHFGEAARFAGTLMILGGVQGRAELDSAFRAINHEAENLGLGELGPSNMETIKDAEHVAQKLWRATRDVLNIELGRPALPEDIIDELRKKLSPSWLASQYLSHQVMIVESTFGPTRFRSKLRPSQLVLRLKGEQGKVKDVYKKWSRERVYGLSAWSDRHYTWPKFEESQKAGGAPKFRYERYYIDGLSAPSPEDQLDLATYFLGNNLMPPPMLRLLRKEDALETLLRKTHADLRKDLLRKLAGISNSEERRDHLEEYGRTTSVLLQSSLWKVDDFGSIHALTRLAWEEVKLALDPALHGQSPDEITAQIADQFTTSLGEAFRKAAARADTLGTRPKLEDIRKLAALISEVERTLYPFPSSTVIKAHARELADNLLKTDRDYMKAYKRALPNSVTMTPGPLQRWAKRRKWNRLEHYLHQREMRAWEAPLPALGKESRRLAFNDLIHILAWVGDPDIPVDIKLMGVALLDRIDAQNNDRGKDEFNRSLQMKAATTVGRWLLEDVVTQAQELPDLTRRLRRLHDLHPGLFTVDFDSEGSYDTAFRKGAATIKRSEALRGLAKGEHPFRAVNVRWALTLLQRLDAAQAWPKAPAERLDLLDFMASTGEFNDELDERILATAKENPKAFLEWIETDQKRSNLFPGDSLQYRSVSTPVGDVVMVPKIAPLRIVRNPSLRTRLFDLLPEAVMGEKPARQTLRQYYGSYKRLWLATRAARRYFSLTFLRSLMSEGSLEDKIFDVLEETDRVAQERMEKAKARWNEGVFDSEDKAFLSKNLGSGAEAWPGLFAHKKENVLESYKKRVHTEAMATLLELYTAWAGTQEPVLQVILDNYPEPTRSSDELLERLIKARRLTPGGLSFLEGSKSYRKPNPIRVAEKHLLDQAVIQLLKFSPSEKVDILLHLGKVERLPKKTIALYNSRILSGDRKKLARDYASIRSLDQLESYLSLLHRKDKALLVRSLFYGKTPSEDDALKGKTSPRLQDDPAQVERLFTRIAIQGRELSPFLQTVFLEYFRILNDAEKAKLLSELVAMDDVSSSAKGPEIMKLGLRHMGVSGAKLAQVLATHKGLVPEEYAAALEEFKEHAQEMEKMKAFTLIKQRLGRIFAMKGQTQNPFDMAELDALSRQALPENSEELSLGPVARRRLLEQVRFLLAEQSRKVIDFKFLGRELGAGSIKIVYKITLDDGRVWVVKLRAPGAKYRVQREFEILEALIGRLELKEEIDVPGAKQLLAEVKSLVQAEMNFVDEARKESGMRDAARSLSLWSRLLASSPPIVPKPHTVYVDEDILVEEFLPTARFSDLPRRNPLGASQVTIAKRAVDWGMLDLVLREWLDPDPHTGNRQASRRWRDLLRTKMVAIDLGQGHVSSIELLKPFMRASLALEAGEIESAAQTIAEITRVPSNKTEADIVAGIGEALRVNPQEGIVERLMQGIIKAEELGAMIRVEYAPLQKAFLIYAGYSPWLPKNYLFRSLERAAMVRILRDRPKTLPELARLWLKQFARGRAAVRAEVEEIISGMKSRL